MTYIQAEEIIGLLRSIDFDLAIIYFTAIGILVLRLVIRLWRRAR